MVVVPRTITFTSTRKSDSIYFSAVPLMDKRIPDWQTNEQDTIVGFVNDIAEEIQEYLNNFYDIYAKRIFNLDKHRLEIKKEYVAKAGLWITKKRYAQWIISDNGVPVDKLDVKGLDVIRSSYPTLFRSFMKEVLLDILRGSTEDQLTEKIQQFKQNLSKQEAKDISKNSAVKDLKKYSPDGMGLFRFQKGTPAHVKAAIAYNQLLKHYKLERKYEPIKNGDKIKWAYLVENPFGLDALGFTAYKDPKEIMDIIYKYIDYNKIFERELSSKLQAFYTAIGWGDVMSAKKSASKFFEF